MSSQTLMPQTLYLGITLVVYIVGALFIETTNSLTNIGKFSSLIIPAVFAFELLKFFIIQKCYQLPGNLSSSSGGTRSSSNTNTNTSLLNRTKDCIKSIMMLTIATLLFAFAAIILGAPSLSKYEETISLSLVLSTLTVLPLQLFIGTRYTLVVLLTNKLDLGKLVAEQYLDFLMCAAIGAVLGAWSASVVMPLDWDRSWQLYPIPNVVGAVSGHLLGCGFSIMKSILFNAKAELKKKSIL